MASLPHPGPIDDLAVRYRAVRAFTDALAAPLSDADATVQPMADASPAKWHLAHTSWFFETFVLRDHVPGYRRYDERFAFLFNSYYEAEGARQPRARRGMITRPSLDEVRAWRGHVDAAMLAALPRLPAAVRALVELGLQHEQQHGELMQTDLLALFAENPLAPALWPAEPDAPAAVPAPIAWIEGAHGVVEIGHDGDGFAFDSEGPRHATLLHPHALADRLVTNGEWAAFVDDGGYRTASLWLSDGWSWVVREGITAPLYWRLRDGRRERFGLDGQRPLDPAAPVTHISQYEADAYARWAGARLPTEAEWEHAATALPIAEAARGMRVAGPARPRAAGGGAGLKQMFGEVWQWTASAFLPYPGFRPAEGAIGEYNGKFMSGQAVLRGSSCATPAGHSRASYRNFFYPHQRWQFTGLRLARDL